MNRGLSRRPLFELPSDQRRFLTLIGCTVRAGWIRVHAFCLMTTHFHFVMECVDGNISATMGWIQSRYDGYFNHTRGRNDGAERRGQAPFAVACDPVTEGDEKRLTPLL